MKTNNNPKKTGDKYGGQNKNRRPNRSASNKDRRQSKWTGENKTDTTQEKPEMVNHPSYWNKNGDQYALVTHAPVYNKVMGVPVRVGASYYSPSGIMAINYIPVLTPQGASDVDPVNRAFNLYMTYLYSKLNATSVGFQQADLAMMVMSMASITTLIGEAKRALGIVGIYKSLNKYYPYALSSAMGFDYDDMVNNYNTYCVKLNNAIDSFNSIRIPRTFDIFDRYYSLATHVLLDEESNFAQMYLFKLKGYYEYKDTEMKATFTPFTNKVQNLGTMLDTLQALIVSWFNSSDLYNINGTIQRAFGDTGYFSIDHYVGEATQFSVSDSYQMQLMNADILGYTNFKAGAFDIVQKPDENTVFQSLSINGSIASYALFNQQHSLIRTYKSSLTPDDNMYSTRWKFNVTSDTDSAYISSIGTELIESITFWRIIPQKEDPTKFFLKDTAVFDNRIAALGDSSEWDVTEISRVLQTIGISTSFRYAPYLYWTDDVLNLTTPGPSAFYTIGDVYNYTQVSEEDVKALNTTALLSIWKFMPNA